MEKETMGTVISVIKQWWLKVNRKPARVHAMDGAAFPHIIKVKYTIDGKDYICRKWIGAGNNVPDKGTTIKVTYWEDKPSKATSSPLRSISAYFIKYESTEPTVPKKLDANSASLPPPFSALILSAV